MKTVKFKDAGRWAESDPLLPQFEVAAGEEVLVTDGLADIIVTAKRGKIVPADKTEAAMLAQKQIEADAAGQEADAVKELTTRIAGLMSEEDFLKLSPDLAGKTSSELAVVFADLEATKQAIEEADKVAALEARVLVLVNELGLDPKDTNQGLDSEGLQAVITSLTEQKAERDAAKNKAKKNPATKDKGKAESK